MKRRIIELGGNECIFVVRMKGVWIINYIAEFELLDLDCKPYMAEVVTL